MLTPQEKHRYHRHLILPDFGEAAQEKLKAARVLVVGAGGLGAPVLLYLAAAGVGTIGIIDDDVVEESNLQRQVLYTTQDIGKHKATVARERLLALNPHLHIKAFPYRLTRDNVAALFDDFDIIADGTDNFATRYLVNDACILFDKINVFAAIFRYEGQVAVFNYPMTEGKRSPNYRHLHPEPPRAGLVPNCAEGGVLGVLPGIIGAMQANEVIKVITGLGEPLIGKIQLYDAAQATLRTLSIPDDHTILISALPEPDDACEAVPLKEWSWEDLAVAQKQHLDLQLLDVRTDQERAFGHAGGQHIPLSELAGSTASLDFNRPLVCYCQSGIRSAEALQILQAAGFPRHLLAHIRGGLNTRTVADA